MTISFAFGVEQFESNVVMEMLLSLKASDSSSVKWAFWNLLSVLLWGCEKAIPMVFLALPPN